MSRKPSVTLLTLALMGAPVAAFAHPSHPSHPPHPTHSLGTPHKCSPHAVAYRVSGSLVSASLTAAGKGRASGAVTITVSGANRAARRAGATAGGTQTYALSEARVGYAHNLAQPNPAAGTRTVVKGTITVLARKCQSTTGAGQVTIEHVVFTPSHKAKP